MVTVISYFLIVSIILTLVITLVCMLRDDYKMAAVCLLCWVIEMFIWLNL